MKNKYSKTIDGRKNECLVCHRVHGSNNKFKLRKHGGRICITCHDPKEMDHKHAVSLYPSGKIQLFANLNLSPSGKIVCYTCHNMHGNRNRKLLHFSLQDLCIKCHR